MPHKPNPFDFVPFHPQGPLLRTAAEFDALGPHYSGYLELELRALTPLHIVGKVEAGEAEHTSHMYTQGTVPCIPASSIRGCLRAFIEALTNGWVGQATPVYEKEKGDPRRRIQGRHVGFRSFGEYEKRLPNGQVRRRPEAVDERFHPGSAPDMLDVASYLFGMVAEGRQANPDEQAYKSKVWVEDAFFTEDALNRKDYWAPDLEGKPFMGGGKPNASNWWYFQPAEVWQRVLPDDGRGRQEMAEFVGEKLRGRKFYFHQDPLTCVQQYHPDMGLWRYPEENPFHPVRLECVDKDQASAPFRIYLDQVPLPLFWLVLQTLLPGERIRHKLGYAKPYGYGSIEFQLRTNKLRVEGPGVPRALATKQFQTGGWSPTALQGAQLADLIDRTALAWLARILTWAPNDKLIFMYPPYGRIQDPPDVRALGFARPVRWGQFEDRARPALGLPRGRPVEPPVDVHNPALARQVASALWDLKHPLDFRLYQEQAERWKDIIEKRQP